jgi:tetratricopeptide (TPR) repeat protein
MRDAAYAATSKRLRASLHERLAGWVARRAGDRLVEYEEIVGYHLEQAHIYGAELGHADADLAARAAARLGSAGRRALWRGDERAAANLLERALTLTRPHTLDVMLELDLSQALWADPARAMAVADVAAERAAAAGDETGAALARAVATLHGVQCGICSLDELEVRVQTALPLVQEDGDHAALATIFWLVGPTVANSRGRYEEWATAAEQGLEHARLAGQQRSNLFRIASALMAGPRPADEALHALEVAAVDTRVWTCLRRAELLAMLDRFDEAWIAAEQARELFREQGGEWGEYALAAVATIAGDSAAACEHLQITCDWLETTRQYAFLGSQASMLGLELCRLGRYDEAEARALQTRELSDPEDFMSQALWRQVQSLVVSHRGDHIAAEQLAREALEYVERTDGLAYQGAALTNLAEVLLAAGRTEEAVDSLTQALERYERKRNIALARRVRERLDTLQPVRK